MNKIKDLIYDKSDILIAILILAIAALIILWRLGIILEYPKQLIGTDEASSVLTEPDEDAEAQADAEKAAEGDSTEVKTGDGAASETATGSENKTEGEGTDANAGEDATKEDTAKADDSVTVTNTAQWDGDKLANDLQVTLTGTTAYEAVSCLVDAGVFADYDEYDTICGEIGYDDEKMKAGVFTFAKGSTKIDIIKVVNWS